MRNNALFNLKLALCLKLIKLVTSNICKRLHLTRKRSLNSLQMCKWVLIQLLVKTLTMQRTKCLWALKVKNLSNGKQPRTKQLTLTFILKAMCLARSKTKSARTRRVNNRLCPRLTTIKIIRMAWVAPRIRQRQIEFSFPYLEISTTI